jgi:hypothetical protein
MELKGYNAEAMIRNLRDKISINYGINYFVRNYYQNKHASLVCDNKKVPNLYVVYKRDFYKTFEYTFRDFCYNNPDLCGEGESINVESLNMALRMDAEYVIFLHTDGIYCIPTMLIKKFCEKYSLVRLQKRINSYIRGDSSKSIQEKTYSFPKKLLEPIESIFERGIYND